MPTCLPPLLARAAEAAADGLAALHGSEAGACWEELTGPLRLACIVGQPACHSVSLLCDTRLALLLAAAAGDVFPQDVSSLVDLSGKKWAHTVGCSLAWLLTRLRCCRDVVGSRGCSASKVAFSLHPAVGRTTCPVLWKALMAGFPLPTHLPPPIPPDPCAYL